MKQSAALCNVLTDLGKDTADQFTKATAIARANEEDTDKLSAATELFVDILSAVSQEKTKSAGYAELLLAYGQTLLAFTRRAGQDGNILGGDVEAEALKARVVNAIKSKSLSSNAGTGPANSKPSFRDKDAEQSKIESISSKDANLHASEVAEDKESKPNDGTTLSEKPEGKPDSAKPGIDKSDQPKVDAVVTQANSVDEVGLTETAKDSIESGAKTEESKANETHDDELKNGASKVQDEIVPATIEEGEIQEDEEDIDNEMLTWEQFEHARLTFESLGPEYRSRLVDVFEALGDLLVESDQGEPAATEYGKAINILSERDSPDEREVSHLQYKRYLALRRDLPEPALQALEEAVRSFGKFATSPTASDADRETLKEMSADLAVFKSALGPALERARGVSARANGGGASNGSGVTSGDADTVTIVQPRRRVRKLADVAGANDKHVPEAKKARVDTESGAANDTPVS